MRNTDVAPCHVLIVEDNAGDALLSRAALRDAEGGYDVRCVGSLEEAKAALVVQRPDVVVMDLSLPDSSGLDTVTAMRAAAPSIALVVLTGRDDDAFALRTLEAGAQDYLLKGKLSPDTFGRAIRHAIGRNHLEEALKTSRQFAQATLDGISAQLCVIDDAGHLVSANAAWRRFAAAEGAPGDVADSHAPYLSITAAWRAGSSDDADAAAFDRGLASVINGDLEHFELEYPCHRDDLLRWFLVRVSRLEGDRPWRTIVTHEDTSERKLAEIATIELKNRYEATIEASGQILYDWDAQTHEMRLAGDVERILGYGIDELSGHSALWMAVVHPDDRQRLIDDMKGVVEHESPCHLVYRVLRKDGSCLVMQDDGYFVRDGTGKPRRMVGFITDITERRNSEQALLDSQQRLEGLINSIDGIVWEADANTFAFTYVSARAQGLLGYPTARWIADPSFWRSHVHPDDLADVERHILHVTMSLRSHRFEYRMLAADGRVVWLEDIVTVLADATGSLRLRGVMVDVTDRKRTEYDLQRATKILEASQSMARLGGWEYDVVKDELFWTDETYRIHDLEPGKYRPTPDKALDFFSLRSRVMLRAAMRDAIDHARPYDLQLEMTSAAGRELTVRMTTHVTVQNGRATHILGTFQDMSERKASEESLRASFAKIMNLELALDEHALVAITDQEGLLTYVNDKFCAVSGYRREELIGRDHGMLNSGFHPKEFFRTMWTTLIRGQVWKGEIRNRAKDGSLFWVETTLVPFLGATGKPYQYVAIRSDITERKRAEQWQQHYAWTLSLITTESPLSEVLATIASFAEQADEGALCAIMQLAPDRRRLVAGSAPSLSVQFLQSLECSDVGAAEHVHAQAAISGRRLVVDDVLDPPEALRGRDLRLPTGARSCWAQPLLSADNKVLGAIAIYHPSPRQPRPGEMALILQSAGLAALAIEHAQQQEDQRLAKVVFQQSVEGIMVTDADERVLMVNPAFAELTGFSQRELVGKTPHFLDSGRSDVTHYEDVRKHLLLDDRWQGEFWSRRKSGEVLPMYASFAIVRGANGDVTHKISVMSDISQQKLQAAKIEQLAFYDSLTGLPNRALFLDRLEHSIATNLRHGNEFALLFMDLDRFKELNDSQGHAVGDLALAEVARRFQGASRQEETLARLGGDEFVLVSEGADQQTALRIAMRLQGVLAEPLLIGGQSISIGTSIGIAMYPQDGETSQDLIKHADIAMYRAKASGGGFCFYQAEMGAALQKRLGIAKRLAQALDEGTLALYYQPKVNLLNGNLAGAEALLRWNDPELGWVSPVEFIPIAEERGMMGRLGAWVLAEACRQMRAWDDAGIAFAGRMAINVSARQLEEPDIVGTLQAIVAAAGLSPERFELELTESSMMVDPERAIQVMHDFTAAGFTLSIDDFGTGYSSLSYLKRFSAEHIKIDISFVRNMLNDRNDHSIVTTIIAMARSLGMSTIAEGVEQPEQADALLAMGCEFAQGFHFGHPEAAAAFTTQWLPRSDATPLAPVVRLAEGKRQRTRAGAQRRLN